jgi:oligopeptidase A
VSIDLNDTAQRQSIASIEESLDGMLTRLKAIAAGTRLTQDTLVEVMSIYNNVAYIFLYLEAIDDEANYQRLLPRRALFHEDDSLDARLLCLMTQMQCDDSEVEEARVEFVDQLRKGQSYDPAASDKINELLNEAKVTLGKVDQSQRDLLRRIGAGDLGASPSAVFYKLMSQTTSAVTRQKLGRAWRMARDSHLAELEGVIDQMIVVRRADCAATGYPSVLARSLERSRLTGAEVEPFLDQYVRHAIESYRRLESEVALVVAGAERPMDHFAFAVNTVFGKSKTPLFLLDECLEYIFAVAQSVFGITLSRGDDPAAGILTYGVFIQNKRIGEIAFDLWNRGQKIVGNYTRGIRNRTDHGDFVQRPIAYVACRFQKDEMGVNRITFQNVHSLFHEFGHAVNHLLIRKRLSYRSGLEYLPPERLECLSMWFEKWVYHAEFERYLSLPDDDPGALRRCCAIKMIEFQRTYVERAVSAALDYEVHSQPSGGLAAAFERLDRRLAISEYVTYGDFPTYFTWPMYVSKPGANFSYLWGSADSCAKFVPLMDSDLDGIARLRGLRDLFTPSFDFDAPSETPDSSAVFSFYERASLIAEV